MVLIRGGPNTHEIDSDQRSVPLTFTVSDTNVTAQVPTNANLLPSNYYMMFAVNGSGVPAQAPWFCAWWRDEGGSVSGASRCAGRQASS